MEQLQYKKYYVLLVCWLVLIVLIFYAFTTYFE